ncbi:TatD family hydrolase [Mycoplasma sp. 'Moose RK']|uniref:TatD family hydrolase n=1 Tax=Mycoplasma sp. 'Moose RK' TaxID=2780095 RepID=UPI0018C2CD23|nr:TatD family hydrolase [Mycoplasma sp. 'Moose RK']MBG0730606.1 TatD family hydrolase [Mycoplasma sp. 'Moose RK']
MYLKIQKLLPRHLNLLKKTVQEFNLNLVFSQKNGKISLKNLSYFDDFSENFEFLIYDSDNNSEFIFAYFVISRNENEFIFNLVFFHPNLDEKWMEIIAEFVLNFINENFKTVKIRLKILKKNQQFADFFSEYSTWTNEQKTDFKIFYQQKYHLVDVHSHPFSEYFPNNEKEIASWFSKNIDLFFMISTTWDELAEVEKIANIFPKVYKIIGIHPNLIKETDNFQNLEKFIDKKVVAIGEIGLDYFYEDNPSEEFQLFALEEQIKIAEKNNLPVMLHIRDKNNDNKAIFQAKSIIEKYPKIDFIFHNFSTNYEIFQELLEKQNCFFSFSGVITFKKSKELRKIIKNTPISRILLETDSPYLSPEPNRDLWPNVSPQIFWVYQTIANLKNLTIMELCEIIKQNVLRIFRIKNHEI